MTGMRELDDLPIPSPWQSADSSWLSWFKLKWQYSDRLHWRYSGEWYVICCGHAHTHAKGGVQGGITSNYGFWSWEKEGIETEGYDRTDDGEPNCGRESVRC